MRAERDLRLTETMLATRHHAVGIVDRRHSYGILGGAPKPLWAAGDPCRTVERWQAEGAHARCVPCRCEALVGASTTARRSPAARLVQVGTVLGRGTAGARRAAVVRRAARVVRMCRWQLPAESQGQRRCTRSQRERDPHHLEQQYLKHENQ
jgi:hypothetical protein